MIIIQTTVCPKRWRPLSYASKFGSIALTFNVIFNQVIFHKTCNIPNTVDFILHFFDNFQNIEKLGNLLKFQIFKKKVNIKYFDIEKKYFIKKAN